jgi:hypothetical protein
MSQGKREGNGKGEVLMIRWIMVSMMTLLALLALLIASLKFTRG